MRNCCYSRHWHWNIFAKRHDFSSYKEKQILAGMVNNIVSVIDGTKKVYIGYSDSKLHTSRLVNMLPIASTECMARKQRESFKDHCCF